MAYSREDIINKVKKELDNPATFYADSFFDNRGAVGGVRYTEIAAEELLREHNLSLLGGISTITRRKSYQTEGHRELAARSKPEGSNRHEEWAAIGMYGKTYDYIGEVLDFQVPLNDVQADKLGKIDLLSFSKSENTAYLLELKKPGSMETLLRCTLEAYTYWKLADRQKLFCDFGIAGAELRKAVLVFENSAAYRDLKDEKCLAARNLMGKLAVDCFVLSEDGGRVMEACKNS